MQMFTNTKNTKIDESEPTLNHDQDSTLNLKLRLLYANKVGSYKR